MWDLHPRYVICPLASCAPLVLRRAELGVRRNPVWRDSSNVKRERAAGDRNGIERMSSDSGILLGIILNLCHFLSVLKGFYLFDCSEYLVHHLGDDCVAVGFEGFGAPLSERKGKAVHIKGKPIISSVNRGDRREGLPSSDSCDTTAFATSSSRLLL